VNKSAEAKFQQSFFARLPVARNFFQRRPVSLNTSRRNRIGGPKSGRDEEFAMTSEQFIRTLPLKKTGVALALTLTLGLTAFSTGAAADPLQAFQTASRGGERIYGFAYSPESRGPGSCAGRQGAAILGGFTNDAEARDPAAACRN
jgi:hypothetical protein